MTLKTLLFLMILAVFSPVGAGAVEPSEMLKDPVLEGRARELGMILRCVVCQNQPIEQSNADLAGDMRVVVRERIQNGDTDEQVLAYMVDRYGDFVLFDPPFKASTYVLWIGPFVIAGFGLFAVVSFFRRRQEDDVKSVASDTEQLSQTTPLSNEERKRLNALLKDDDV